MKLAEDNGLSIQTGEFVYLDHNNKDEKLISAEISVNKDKTETSPSPSKEAQQ